MTRKYSKDHEWVLIEGDIATVGITEHAQNALGDIVFVELPAPGSTVTAHTEAAVVESVKAASDVYAPLSGTIVNVNEALADTPGLVNSDPLGEGWFFKLKLSAPAEVEALLDEAAYTHFLSTL